MTGISTRNANQVAPIKPAKTKAEMLHLMLPVKERLGLQAAQENEALIAFELEVVSVKLDRFGWSGLSDAMKDRLTADWVDVLGKYDVKEVKRAIATCLSSKPKTPTEYEVQAALLDYRKKALHRAIQEPEMADPPRVVSEAMKAEADALVAGFAKSATIPRNQGETTQDGETPQK